MKTLRTDNLEKSNKEETPGKVYILDDYVLFGERFSKSFLGNINYSMPVFNVPNRLLNLIY